jgi:hypothetical protein
MSYHAISLSCLGENHAHTESYLMQHRHDRLHCCVFSCFSASQIREFASRQSVGRKNAKIWAFPEYAETQRLNQKSVFESLRKHCFRVAIAPLSHCDTASIATPQRLYRIAIKAFSQRERASIAIPKGKNG